MNPVSRILLVDDDVSIQRAVAPLLRSRGYHVDVVSTGADAVAAAANQPPDLVVLDLGLPDLEGAEVCRRMRDFTKAPFMNSKPRDLFVNSIRNGVPGTSMPSWGKILDAGQADAVLGYVLTTFTKTSAQPLRTRNVPDPDLLIRTSGEMRVSNFLLWQISYTELVVTQTLWPDFRKAQFFGALEEYKRRHRRFGGL